MLAHLEEMRKTEETLNYSIKGTKDAIEAMSKKGPASLTRMVDDAIEELKRARKIAVGSLQDPVNAMNNNVKASAETFSKAAADVENKATAASEVMDALNKEAFDLGKLWSPGLNIYARGTTDQAETVAHVRRVLQRTRGST